MSKQGPHPSLDLRKVVSAAQLPALPQSAIRLLELAQDPDLSATEFAVPIESDPGLASQVLRFVNSSYFGFSREIGSAKLAITLVGVRTIRNFALWSAVFSLIPNPKCGPFDLKSLWQDSLRLRLFARAMGNLLGIAEAEEPFAAALLQDMAVPVLAKEATELYAGLLQIRHRQQVRLSALEREILRLVPRRGGRTDGAAMEPARTVGRIDREPPGRRYLGRPARKGTGQSGRGPGGPAARRQRPPLDRMRGLRGPATRRSSRRAVRRWPPCWHRLTGNSPNLPPW